jgi:hypothetical protein
MIITEGKYRRRDGSVVTVRKNNDPKYPWIDEHDTRYAANGYFYASVSGHPYDLIERIDDDVLTIVNMITALPEYKRKAVLEIFKE